MFSYILVADYIFGAVIVIEHVPNIMPKFFQRKKCLRIMYEKIYFQKIFRRNMQKKEKGI